MQILLILTLFLPLIVLLLLPGGSLLTGGLWFSMILLICIWMFWIMASPVDSPQDQDMVETGPRMLPEADQPDVIREVMDVRIATEKAGTKIFRGRLRQPATTVYNQLKQAFPEKTVPLVQQDEQLGTAIVLMPASVERATMERPVRAGSIGCSSA